MSNLPARLECSGISVRFGGVLAVHDVGLQVPASSIVGLVGPNGAGKSTLFGVLSGLLRPSAGIVRIEGKDVTHSRPQVRARLGLSRTFQHPELFPGVTVRDHLVLAYRAHRAHRRVWSDLFTLGSLQPPSVAERQTVDGLIDMLGLGPFAEKSVSGLPLGVARLLELGRALATSPRVLLLDEPSSGLDSADTAHFETTLRRVTSEHDISVLLVEHDIDLVMRLCSTVSVLDFGRLVAQGTPQQIHDDPAVRAAFLGEELADERSSNRGNKSLASGSAALKRPAQSFGLSRSHDRGQSPSTPTVAPAISVQGLCVRYGDATALNGVSFTLAKGRSLAVLGANGAGKSSLARALSGLVPYEGRVTVNGTDVSGWPTYRLRRVGVVHLPETRGVFRQLTVLENLRMAVQPLSDRRQRRQAIEAAFELFPELKTRQNQLAATLSGGEQQILSLARALVGEHAILVADELSLGLAPLMVDTVFEGLERARELGLTVIMTEQYVHRALSFADECIVLQRGEVSWAGPADRAQQEVLSRYLGEGMMAGGSS